MCPYCRHVSNEHESIPTNITNATVDTRDIYIEMADIHRTIEQALRAEILALNQSLRLEIVRAGAAEDWAAAAEIDAKNAHDALYDYKVARRSEDVTVKKQEYRDTWTQWTGATGRATGAGAGPQAQ